ncbi:hypothetical protein BDB01DRAFT_788752 [Pilobolus umbonatus]|nr:hypothetical protein BDB01DRAFT_788752 [Pilobolus umbonatus]
MKNLRSIYALWTPFQQQYYQELIEALSVNSIRTDSQLLQSSLKDVCSKTNIKRPVIRAFIQQVLYDTRIQEARQTYKPPTYLLTGIKELDTLLEGGLLFGEVIELYGESSMHVSNYISHFIASYLLNMKQESVYIYDISGMFEAKHLKRNRLNY